MHTRSLPITIVTCLVGTLLLAAIVTMLSRFIIRKQKQREKEDMTDDYIDRRTRKCVVKRGVVVSAAPTRQASKRTTTRISSWHTDEWRLSSTRASRISEKIKSKILHTRPTSPDVESLITPSESKMKWLDNLDGRSLRPPMPARMPSSSSVDQHFLPGESKVIGQALSKSLATAYNGPPRLKGAAFFESQRELLSKPMSLPMPPPRSRYSHLRWSHSTAPARSSPTMDPPLENDHSKRMPTVVTVEVPNTETPDDGEGKVTYGPRRNSWAVPSPKKDNSRQDHKKAERRNRKSLKVKTQVQTQLQPPTLDIHETSFLHSASSLSLPQRNSVVSDHTAQSVASSAMSTTYTVEDAQQIAFIPAVPRLPSHHLSLKNTLVSKYSPAWKGYTGDKAPFSPIVTAIGSSSSGSKSHVVSPITPDFPRQNHQLHGSSPI